MENFEARNGNYETNAVVNNQGTKQREQRTLGHCWQWKANGQCSKGDNCSYRHDINKRAKTITAESFSEIFHAAEREKGVETPKSWRQKPKWEEWLDCRARITSKELAPIHCVKSGILQNACSTRPIVVVGLGKSAHMRIARLMNSPAKGLKIMVAKVQWLCWKVHDNWVAYFRIWSRRSLHRFCGRAVVRHADIRDQNPSLGMICPGDLHQRNPNAPKFEDRSQEETEWQERCARETPWRLAKSVLKFKEHERATFFSPSESRCLLSQSTLELGERDFVVDSGASMHMISKKKLNSAEMYTLTTSRSPSTVKTANWEVRTHEEATVYVKQLDIFLTVQVLEFSPAVLPLGKLCDEHEYSYEWINGQKPHLV